MKKQEFLDIILKRKADAFANLQALKPEHLNIQEKVEASESKRAKELYHTYETMKWQPVGQAIVYGYERRINFVTATNLCSKMQTLVKEANKRKFLDEEVFTQGFLAALAEVTVDYIQEKRSKAA